MHRRVNPREAKRMMQRMGINQKEIDAELVLIKTAQKEIVISNPSVIMVNMMGQDTYQISGDVSERNLDAEIDVPATADDPRLGVPGHPHHGTVAEIHPLVDEALAQGAGERGQHVRRVFAQVGARP